MTTLVRMRASRLLSILMTLQAYDFSRRFAWIADRFGVSWQLNLVDPT